MKISTEEFLHPSDAKALEALQAIPLFSTVVKKVLSIGYERSIHGINMASSIRLSDKQLPEVYNHLPPICKKLGIPEPELYLTMDTFPNAWTYGDTNIFITITSGLLESMNDEEIDAVIAHECGHILCRHVLYHTIGRNINEIMSMIPGIASAAAIPMQYALMYWSRMSEYSADRVASIVTSPEVVMRTMARLSGGSKSITANVNYNEWARQAEEFKDFADDGKWNKLLYMLSIMGSSHPFAAMRVNEIIKWGGTPMYHKLKDYIDGVSIELEAPELLCPECKNKIDTKWFFCNYCGTKLK